MVAAQRHRGHDDDRGEEQAHDDDAGLGQADQVQLRIAGMSSLRCAV